MTRIGPWSSWRRRWTRFCNAGAHELFNQRLRRGFAVTALAKVDDARSGRGIRHDGVTDQIVHQQHRGGLNCFRDPSVKSSGHPVPRRPGCSCPVRLAWRCETLAGNVLQPSGSDIHESGHLEWPFILDAVASADGLIVPEPRRLRVAKSTSATCFQFLRSNTVL